MGIYVGGQEYAKAYVGGLEFTGALAGGAAYRAAADQPGMIITNATRTGGRNFFYFRVTDPDGVASIDSAFLRATDGTQQDISDDWMRLDANSFRHEDDRRHDRWRSGLVSATYTDGNSVQSTVTANWSV